MHKWMQICLKKFWSRTVVCNIRITVGKDSKQMNEQEHPLSVHCCIVCTVYTKHYTVTDTKTIQSEQLFKVTKKINETNHLPHFLPVWLMMVWVFNVHSERVRVRLAFVLRFITTATIAMYMRKNRWTCIAYGDSGTWNIWKAFECAHAIAHQTNEESNMRRRNSNKQTNNATKHLTGQ